jgi:hypothetical protein
MTQPIFPAIPFEAIKEPFDTLCQAYINRVDRDWPDKVVGQVNGSFVVEALLRANYNAYKTVLFLCAEGSDGGRKPEYSLLAAPIDRTILDSLYAIVFLFESLEERATWYLKSGWRERHEELIRLEKMHGQKPSWRNWLDGYRRVVDQHRVHGNVSAEELADSKLIKYWPIPGRMKTHSGVSEDRRQFFVYLDDWFYRGLSAQAHLSGSGLAMQAAALFPWHDAEEERRWKLDKNRSDNFLLALVLMLSILCEVEIQLRFGMQERLLYIWGTLTPDYGIARELFAFRYAEGLRA